MSSMRSPAGYNHNESPQFTNDVIMVSGVTVMLGPTNLHLILTTNKKKNCSYLVNTVSCLAGAVLFLFFPNKCFKLALKFWVLSTLHVVKVFLSSISPTNFRSIAHTDIWFSTTVLSGLVRHLLFCCVLPWYWVILIVEGYEGFM